MGFFHQDHPLFGSKVLKDWVGVGRSPSTSPLQTFSPNRPRVLGRCFVVSWNFLGNEILVSKGKSGNYHPNNPGFFQWLDNNSETVRFQTWKPLKSFFYSINDLLLLENTGSVHQLTSEIFKVGDGEWQVNWRQSSMNALTFGIEDVADGHLGTENVSKTSLVLG